MGTGNFAGFEGCDPRAAAFTEARRIDDSNRNIKEQRSGQPEMFAA